MVLPEIAAVGSIIKTAKNAAELAKSVKELSAGNVVATLEDKTIKLRELIISLQSGILTIQVENSELKTLVSDLDHKVVELTKRNKDFENYRLKEIAPGVLVYAYKAVTDDSGPEHYLCPNCFDQGEKSILQFQYKCGRGAMYLCHRCSSEIYDHTDKVISDIGVVRTRSSRWDGY